MFRRPTPVGSSFGAIVITVASVGWVAIPRCIMSIERMSTPSTAGGLPLSGTSLDVLLRSRAPPPSLTAITVPAPISAAMFTGSGFRTPPSTAICGPIFWDGYTPGNRNAGQHGLPQEPTAQHELTLGHDVRGDQCQRRVQVLDEHVGGHRLQVGAHATVREQARVRDLEAEQGRAELVEDPGDLLVVVSEGQQAGDGGADAGAGDVVEVQAGFAEHLDRADVRIAANASGPEREADLETGQVASGPAEPATGGRPHGKKPRSQLGLVLRRERQAPRGTRPRPGERGSAPCSTPGSSACPPGVFGPAPSIDSSRTLRALASSGESAASRWMTM